MVLAFKKVFPFTKSCVAYSASRKTAQHTDKYIPFNFNWKFRQSNADIIPKVYFTLGNEPDQVVTDALVGLLTELG